MTDEQFDLLNALVDAHGPSGFEKSVAQLYRDYVTPFAHRVTTDVMGNVTAIINPDAPLRVMYAGHMDEIGFIIHHIDANGFLYFNTIGGTDVATEIGQRVWVHGKERVPGVIGRKAIQMLAPSEMSSMPKLKDLWIDIGASSREEAEAVAPVGRRHLAGNDDATSRRQDRRPRLRQQGGPVYRGAGSQEPLGKWRNPS